MPKATRSSRTKKRDTSITQRKFAVSQKEVLEKIVTNGDEISAVPAQDLDLTKKDLKKKLRHEAWLEKLDRSYAVKKKLQKKENRKKNDLQVDLTGINDILNTIDVKSKDEFTSQAIHSKKLEQQPKQPAIPSNKIKSKKAKKQAEMQEILRMQKVMQHGAFKQNPLETIRQHVQNTFTQ